ncbi:Piwi-like protein 2, partial [Armadillidium nasatum]
MVDLFIKYKTAISSSAAWNIDLKTGLWLVIFSSRDQSRTLKFIETMKQVTGAMGIFIGDPKLIKLSNDSTDTYINKIKENYYPQLQLAVVIFPMPREDRYSAVKRLTCSDLGVASQCINSRTISQDQKLRSVTQKIALQINCKLGGELWALKIPMSALMVCGVDVYHSALRKGNSVVGFVSSLNNSLTRWYSKSLFQNPGEEIINGLKSAFLESLRKYYEENHTLPKTIVIYRDGIGDGLLKVTEEHEIPQLTSIFSNFEGYEPKFYFVVVNKRINTRIFASLSGRGLDNPPPGSIVDHTITKRHWYDFLLVSQHVRQGTVSPTHYVVLKDSESLKTDHMQRLTYKLTHLYYNWPGTIRVPAPCQYAQVSLFSWTEYEKEAHVTLQ